MTRFGEACRIRPHAVITLGLALLTAIACSPGPAASNSTSGQQAAPAAGDSDAPPTGPVLAAWSQIVAGGASAAEETTGFEPLTMVARFVVEGTGQSCSDFTLQSDPAGAWSAVSPQERSNPDAASFPVTLCQAVMPADWSAAALKTPQAEPVLLRLPSDDGQMGSGPEVVFPGPAGVGRKRDGEIVMVSLGDTGCRGMAGQEDCSLDGTDWPLDDLLEVATTRYDPDLVIHVGDYRYYKQGVTPDTWGFWYHDFFRPAQRSLLNAPWAFARGNHEECHIPTPNPDEGLLYMYGQGWYYFFEPTTSLATSSCPPAPQPMQDDPWYFDVAVMSAEAEHPHRLVMIDTAATTPKDAAAKTAFSNQMTQNFETALRWANEAESAWWVTHKPATFLFYYQGWLDGDDDVGAALDAALQGKPPLCDPACSPSTYLAGHLHNFEHIRLFETGSTSGRWLWPQTVIVGNGGVSTDGGFAASPCTYEGFPASADATGVVTWDTRHGFMVWTRSAATMTEESGWSAEPYFMGSGGPAGDQGLAPCAPTR